MRCKCFADTLERLFRILPLAAVLLVDSCGTRPAEIAECSSGEGAGQNAAWIVQQGWHTEIAIPAEELTGELAVFREIFSGARVLSFGYGKRTFMTAKVETAAELIMGPFPGPSAIQVTGLSAPPQDAYDGPVFAVALPSGGAARLSGFIWDTIEKTRRGDPKLIADGHFPGSLFYAGARPYNIGFTCNSWSAQALEAAGLQVDASGIVWAGGAMEAAAGSGRACRASPAAR